MKCNILNICSRYNFYPQFAQITGTGVSPRTYGTVPSQCLVFPAEIAILLGDISLRTGGQGVKLTALDHRVPSLKMRRVILHSPLCLLGEELSYKEGRLYPPHYS